MKYIVTLCIICVAFLSACSGERTTVAESVFEPVTQLSEDTQIAAVMIHADWCGSCKAMEPKLREIRNDAPIDGVQFFTIDFTDRDEDRFFATARSLHVESAIQKAFKGKVKTGVLLLVDRRNGMLLSDIRKTMSTDEMRAEIKNAADAA